MDYDTSFKKNAQDAIFAPDPYRSSDHDPVLIGLELGEKPGPVEVGRVFGPNRYSTAANVARTFTDPIVVYFSMGIDLGRIVAAGSGAPVTRLSGINRYDTATKIAQGWALGEADSVYVASGAMFADALAVGPLAGIENSPVLLTQVGALSSETVTALDRLDPQEIVILGGPERISDTVFAQASVYADISRLFGDDRYDTAAEIALQIPDSDEVLLASGQVFPDAFAVGVYAGINNAPLLLTEGDSLNVFAASSLQGREPTLVTLIGGEMALFDQVRLDVIALFDR